MENKIVIKNFKKLEENFKKIDWTKISKKNRESLLNGFELVKKNLAKLTSLQNKKGETKEIYQKKLLIKRCYNIYNK